MRVAYFFAAGISLVIGGPDPLALQPISLEPSAAVEQLPADPQIDCATAVPSTLDVSPVRSPQAVHSFLANRFVGKRIVEIGTRNGDGMACLARNAKEAVAVEMDEPYCDKLRTRSQEMQREGAGGFRVVCSDYRAVTTLPDADVFTWWEQEPHLLDADVLNFLRSRAAAGRISRGAQAVLLFDPSWRGDAASWEAQRAGALWHAEVQYDETADCVARAPWGSTSEERYKGKGGYTCRRAKGSFIVAGFALHPDDL